LGCHFDYAVPKNNLKSSVPGIPQSPVKTLRVQKTSSRLSERTGKTWKINAATALAAAACSYFLTLYLDRRKAESWAFQMPFTLREKEHPLGQEHLGEQETCLLRPDPLCLVATSTSADRLYCYRTCGFRRSATFKDPGSYPECFDLSLQAGNLRLKNGDLVFLLFYRVIYIGHCLGLTKREYINNGINVNRYKGALVQSFTLVECACGP